MDNKVIVIGGGPAGLIAAGHLSMEGFDVTVAEKENDAGGHIRNWYQLFPDRKEGKEILTFLSGFRKNGNPAIRYNTEIKGIEKVGDGFLLMTSDGENLTAGAVVVATGFDLFDSARKEEYGYGIYDNVITSADLEEKFRSGKILKSDGSEPRRLGLIHCVGSRDEKVGNLYCSKLCCVTAVKQAMEIRELLPSSKVTCFYMDMRMGGAHYEELYRESQEKYGINYIRGKVSEVGVGFDRALVVKVEDTLAGRPLRMELDMVVLMAGMENSRSGKALGSASGLKTGENRFFEVLDSHYGSNLSNMKGLFYAGTCTAPMNLTETISHAHAAAFEVIKYLRNLKS
jgi:heterodisulfide reductase subunit A